MLNPYGTKNKILFYLFIFLLLSSSLKGTSVFLYLGGVCLYDLGGLLFCGSVK